MNSPLAAIDNRKYRNKIHPKKFALWAGCVSIFMMFAGFTSAYIVRQAAGNWMEFPLPQIFYVSAGVMLASSLFLQLSYWSFINGKGTLYRSLMTVGFVLGIVFIYCQYQGWIDMQAMGVEVTGNPSGSFVYVFSWIHAGHVLGGIAILLVAMIHAFGLDYYVTPARKLRFEMTLTYWHFVDLLWIYLLVFFTLQS